MTQRIEGVKITSEQITFLDNIALSKAGDVLEVEEVERRRKKGGKRKIETTKQH